MDKLQFLVLIWRMSNLREEQLGLLLYLPLPIMIFRTAPQTRLLARESSCSELQFAYSSSVRSVRHERAFNPTFTTERRTSLNELHAVARADVIVDDRRTEWRHQRCQQSPVIPVSLSAAAQRYVESTCAKIFDSNVSGQLLVFLSDLAVLIF